MEGSPVSLDPSLESHRNSSGDGPGDNPTFMPTEGTPSTRQCEPFRPLLVSGPWSSCCVGYSDVTTLHFFFTTTHRGDGSRAGPLRLERLSLWLGHAVFQACDCAHSDLSVTVFIPTALRGTHPAPAEFSAHAWVCTPAGAGDEGKSHCGGRGVTATSLPAPSAQAPPLT